MTKYIQSFITMMSFQTSLEEVAASVVGGNLPFVSGIIQDCKIGELDWTSPHWAKQGDIVFFMHSKTAINKIKKMERDLNRFYKESPKAEEVKEYEKPMRDFIDKAYEDYEFAGGKIFAIGRVSGTAYSVPRKRSRKYYHWKSRVYAPIDDVTILKNPIPREELVEFIEFVRQATISPVYGEQFDQLMKMIKENNTLPPIYDDLKAMPKEMADLKKNDWLSIGIECDYRYQDEGQFRSYYATPFLKSLTTGDKIYREVKCIVDGETTGYVDNVIEYYDAYLPVEVKVNLQATTDIEKQLEKYAHADEIIERDTDIVLNRKRILHNYVLVIDFESIYMYFSETRKIKEIYKIRSLKKLDDIFKIRQKMNRILKDYV